MIITLADKINSARAEVFAAKTLWAHDRPDFVGAVRALATGRVALA